MAIQEIDGAKEQRLHPSGAGKAVLLAILVFAFTSNCAALSPDTHISQFGHTAWRVQDGALSASPTSFAQTPDGYMWIGTKGGLYRFDGVTFAAWNPPPGKQYPFGNPGIQSLYVARDGGLWIGSDAGLSHLANGIFTSISAPIGAVKAITEDRNAAIWIARENMTSFTGPICKISANDEQCFGGSSGIQAFTAGSFAADAQGRLWVGAGGTLIEWDGRLMGEYRLPRESEIDTNRIIDGLTIDGNGTIWAGVNRPGPGNGLQQFVNGKWRQYAAPGWSGASIDVLTLLLDRDHCLWVGTWGQGLYRIHGASVDHFGHAEGLSGNTVSGVFEDREGGIWVATDEGVDHFHDLPIVAYANFKGLSQMDVQAVLARRDGSIMVGTKSSFVSIRGSAITTEVAKPQLGDCMLEDHRGDLWICTSDGGLGVVLNGRLHDVLKSDSTGEFHSLAEDTDHSIWAEFTGIHARLIRIEDFQVREEFKPPQLPPAFSVIADPLGGVWSSPFTGNLIHYQKGKWQTLSMAPLIQKYGGFGGIFNMSMDPEGTLWGTVSRGVVAYRNGKLQLLTEQNGLPCSRAYSTIIDLHGNLWIHQVCGLTRIERSEVQRWWANPESKLTVSTFTTIDGFRLGIPYGRPAATVDGEGKLWFQNENAVMMIDPGKVVGNSVVPLVHVERVIADRKNYPAQSDLLLPSRTRQLEFDYSGLSFVVPSRVLFRYMLEGYDHQWQEPGTRRAAFYNDLPPGKYTFRVIACNDGGLWNTVGASLQFAILPAYYQTNWFVALCFVVLITLLWGIYQLRLRRLQQEFAIGLEARVNERTRIARDLHDTLLQSLHGVMFQFQAARNLLPLRPNEAMRSLDDAIGDTKAALTESRAAIQDMRSEPKANENIAEMLIAESRELAHAKNEDHEPPKFELTEEGERRTMSPTALNEVRRIALEILRNAYRHAGAQRIEAEVRYGDQMLRFRIRDDGKGIDPAILNAGGRAGHWGIRGVRERAERIGARIDFWSEVGAGTEVEVEVPAPIAYEKESRNRAWSRLLRKVRYRAQRSKPDSNPYRG